MKRFIITGISGAGKTTVLKAFEDLDFYCVDNIPTVLLHSFFDSIDQFFDKSKEVAVGVDIREKFFLKEFEHIFYDLKIKFTDLKIIYLDAKDEVIIKRFKETRRLHPVKEKNFKDAIIYEREKLKFLNEKADIFIDTSNYNVHELKKFIYDNFSFSNKSYFNVNIVSFGFKHGSLIEGDLIFDVRFLNNPYFVDKLKDKTGKHQEIRSYIFNDSRTEIFLSKIMDLLEFLLPQFKNEGKSYVVIGIGCTGGIHRSVAIVEELGKKLSKEYNISVRHRDLKE